MKYLVRFGIGLAFFLSMMLAPSATANVHAAGTPIWFSWLRNSQSRMCIQPEYQAGINGLAIVQQSCNEDNVYQQWLEVRVDNSRSHFVNRGSGQCLDDRNGATADSSPVQQWTCNSTSTTMMWRAQEIGPYTYRYINERSGKCLDVRFGSFDPGAVLQIYHCTSNNGAQGFDIAQMFRG